MKTLRTFSKLITVVAILAMVLSFASCKSGALKLESFTVDKTSVKTNYLIGEEIDFSGIKATAKYSDESLNKVYTYDELTITYDKDITATVGDKEVTVSFDDPHLNVKQEAKVQIKVTEEPIVSTDPQLVVGFEKPDSLISFDSNNAGAGKSEYGDAAFSGEFAKGGKTYVIGNVNTFKLNPKFTILDDTTDTPVGLTEFFAVVEISVDKDGTYAALTSVAGENNAVEYYDGDTLIATVNTYKGEYQFSANAAGKKVKISVLPSEDYYIFDGNAVVLEANIIDAYNVYEAWQLSVIDNDTSRTDWEDIKTANGILGLNVAGIVLHKDITLTAGDVPSTFFYTTEAEVTYTDTTKKENEEGRTVTIPVGTKYLKDGTNVYQRNGTSEFVIQGNFFTLDTSSFPLVPSPGVFGKDSGYDYGSDFSNATLIRFVSLTDYNKDRPDDVATVTIDNISLIGNAKRDNLIDSTEALASAGGLIFIKSSHHSEITINNVIGNSYFIAYFADYGGDLFATNVKCYDSYQNAAMVWGSSVLSFTDSYLNGCGGPIIIAQSVIDENEHPVLTVSNTKTETHLTGQEIWFTAVKANAIISQITALGNGLQSAGFGNFVAKDGTMNIKGLLMANGDDATMIIGGVDAQGSAFFDGQGIDRTQSAENVNWAYIMQITKGAASLGAQIPPFFTVNDASGAPQTIYFNGTTFVDLAGNAISLETHAALCLAFATADTITLTQGGLSVVFEFYH